jgi:DNA-binding LacI/PurR family transcriptional regulator
MDGIEAVAAASHYDVLIGTGGRRPEGERLSLDVLLEHRADGLILVGPRLGAHTIDRVAALVPVVLIARAIDSPHVDAVVNDDHVGARLAVDHLADLGHTRIAHIDGGSGASAAARRTGYETAMRRRGLDAYVQVIRGDYTDIAGVAAAERLLATGPLPTAIFAANDFVAVGVRDRLEDAGLVIPRDLSLVGYDNTFLAALHRVALTTINQPRALMGELAMQALIERIEGERTRALVRRLSPDLVVRSSTSAPKRERADG